jgi:hypothetical protein
MVNTGVEYTPGQLLAVVTPATVVVVDAPTDWSLAGPLWELALDDAPIDEILDCLVRRGIRTAPTFAVVRVEETSVRVLVRGPVRVGVERSGDPVRLDASGATTWLEAVVSTPRRVLVGAVEPGVRSPYLVATGVVLAGGLVLPCVPQAAQRYEEERREIAPPPPPAVTPSQPQLPASATPTPTSVTPPAPPAQAPSPDSAPAIVDLTRLESPTSQGIMAGRSAWMDPAPSPKSADGPKPPGDLGGPVRKAPEDDAPAAFRSEPTPFRPPAASPSASPEPFRSSSPESFRSSSSPESFRPSSSPESFRTSSSPEPFRSPEPEPFRSPEPASFRSSEPASFRSEPTPFRSPSAPPAPPTPPAPSGPSGLSSSPSEPAAFRPPAARPMPPGATPPAPPSPLSPPAAGPGVAPPVPPSPLTPPSSLTPPSPLSRPMPPGSQPPAESLQDDKDDDRDEAEGDGPPPGPSPADLPSFDPPSMSVPLPSVSRPAAVFAPPVDRPEDDAEDDGRDKVVASPSGLPVRVRGQSMPVDLRGTLNGNSNGTYREAPAARTGAERPAPTFDRPSFENSPFARPMFEAPAQVQDVTDRSGFQRPPYDRQGDPLVDEVDDVDDVDDIDED